MKYLFVLNDPPYGSERSFNGIRLAAALLEADNDAEVTVFLLSDAVGCAASGQVTRPGQHNIAEMLEPVVDGGELLLCGMCMDARGLAEDDLVDGAQRLSLADLADRTASADKVLVF